MAGHAGENSVPFDGSMDGVDDGVTADAAAFSDGVSMATAVKMMAVTVMIQTACTRQRTQHTSSVRMWSGCGHRRMGNGLGARTVLRASECRCSSCCIDEDHQELGPRHGLTHQAAAAQRGSHPAGQMTLHTAPT